MEDAGPAICCGWFRDSDSMRMAGAQQGRGGYGRGNCTQGGRLKFHLDTVGKTEPPALPTARTKQGGLSEHMARPTKGEGK